MNKRFARLGLTALIVLALSLLVVGTVLADAGQLNIPLNNDTAQEGTDCPATGGPYWHFVISPNNGDSYFITFHLNLGDATTYNTSVFVPNGTQLDNIFLAVPAGKTLTSLNKDGSSADIYWNGDNPEPGKFQLSHVCSGTGAQDLTVSKTATPSYTRTFTWNIDKSVDDANVFTAGGAAHTFNYTVNVSHDTGTDSDWAVNGTITVHNPNSFDVTGVSLSDATSGGTCTVTPASVDVLAGSDANAAYTCTFASNPSSGTNTATATWTNFGSPNTSATGSADYTFGAPTTIVDGNVSVTDTLGGMLGTVSYTDTGPTTFTYSKTFTDPAGTCTSHDNTAKFTTSDTGTTGSASQTVTDCQGADLTVSKTANTSFDRTFTWGITKDVDKTLVEQVGGNATFNYTIKVSHDAGTDSNWKVFGTITVTNPNDWEDVTVNLSDSLCAVNTPITVPAGKSVDVPYSCNMSSGNNGTNTVTATWDADAAHTPDNSASGSQDFTFGNPTNLIDDCVSVSDSYAGSLGTTCVGDANPKSFTYSRTVPVPANDCVSYPNTATFTTDDQGKTGSASQTVKVCGPAKTGALTMGFWQNKNGQGIITGGASVSNVCKSGTWLRQFAPFQDLSSTASCSAVGTYVTNVIKAANASGASMNAMLKAQMLATSLDVYFSDPALGGNKINAPAPIGGVTIDLTKICKMIDGSGGTATCGGTYQNVSSAFGGATSMTVSQMLAYAASQSNSGGSVWYGQVKATQELAKNAFDAINNQVAFAP